MVASKVGITVEAALNHVCRFHMDARCCSFGKEGPRGRITRRECAQVCRNPNTVSEAAAALPRVPTARGSAPAPLPPHQLCAARVWTAASLRRVQRALLSF